MIQKVTAYGILITDKWGTFDDIFTEDDISYIKSILFEDDSFIAQCSSAQDQQIVIGFEVEIDKNTDFVELEEKWRKEFSKQPDELKNIIEKVGYTNSTNVHFMAGKW